MQITTKLVLDMNTGAILEHEFFEYDGPLMLCDRAAQAAAKNAASTAQGTAATDTAEGQAAQSFINPIFQHEATAEHLFTPGQENELLTAANAGSGAVSGAEKAALQREAASTNNATALTKNLQTAALDRMKSAAGASEGVAAQDVMGAKQLNQQGLAGEAGLFNTDTDAALKAMGIQTNDINTGIEAGKSGWLQNMNATISALTKGAGGAGAVLAGGA